MKRTTINDHVATITEAIALAKSRGEIGPQKETLAALRKARNTSADILNRTGGTISIRSPLSTTLNAAQDTRDRILREILDYVHQAAVRLFDKVKAAKTDQTAVRALLGWLAQTEPHKLTAKETDQLLGLVRP